MRIFAFCKEFRILYGLVYTFSLSSNQDSFLSDGFCIALIYWHDSCFLASVAFHNIGHMECPWRIYMLKNGSLPLKVCFMKIFALFFFLVSSANAAVIDVFFAGGQSNATDAWADGLSSTLNTRYDNALVVYQNHPGKWLRSWYGGNAEAGNGAPSDLYEQDFYNNSGTGLLQSALDGIVANGDTYNFSGFFWYQGESEITSAEDVSRYNFRFNSMLGQMQSDLSLDPFRFVIAAVDANRPLLKDVQIEQIEAMRSVQFEIGSQALGASYDVASGEYNWVDKWHLDEGSARQVGVEMANAYISAVPIPSAVWLFGSGLIGLAGLVRRKV